MDLVPLQLSKEIMKVSKSVYKIWKILSGSSDARFIGKHIVRQLNSSLWNLPDVDLNLYFTAYYLRDLGQVTQIFCVPIYKIRMIVTISNDCSND